MVDLNTASGAVISRCQTYRYALWRNWDLSLPKVMFVCLNPSTADATADDPTLRRCMDFARRWGFGGSYTANLFAFRATDPSELAKAKHPIGPRNNQWIRRLAEHTDLAVAAWGNQGNQLQRDQEIRTMIAGMQCLKMNRSGQPAHPLYQPASALPVPFVSDVPITPSKINAVFSTLSTIQSAQLQTLRALIFDVANQHPEIGQITETLKWGQPAYLTPGSGTTIRLGLGGKERDQCALFVHCQTTLVSTWRTMFPDTFDFDGNRALLIRPGQSLPEEALRFCILMALRYHLDKIAA